MTSPAWSPRRKAFASLFLLFHWAAVLAWALPARSPIRGALGLPPPPAAPGDPADPDALPRSWGGPTGPLYAWLCHSGQWQDWALFAPEPTRWNLHTTATVRCADGRDREVALWRLSRMGFFAAWRAGRHRKFLERIAAPRYPMADHAEARRDLARWIARGVAREGAVPVRVTLWLHCRPIAGPGGAGPEAAGDAWVDYTRLLRDADDATRVLLLDHPVAPEDLR